MLLLVTGSAAPHQCSPSRPLSLSFSVSSEPLLPFMLTCMRVCVYVCAKISVLITPLIGSLNRPSGSRRSSTQRCRDGGTKRLMQASKPLPN